MNTQNTNNEQQAHIAGARPFPGPYSHGESSYAWEEELYRRLAVPNRPIVRCAEDLAAITDPHTIPVLMGSKFELVSDLSLATPALFGEPLLITKERFTIGDTVVLEAQGTTRIAVTEENCPCNLCVLASEGSHVSASSECGDGKLLIWALDQASIETRNVAAFAYDQASVSAFSKFALELHDDAKALLHGSGKVLAYGRSRVDAHCTGLVIATDEATVVVAENEMSYGPQTLRKLQMRATLGAEQATLLGRLTVWAVDRSRVCVPAGLHENESVVVNLTEDAILELE